MAEFEEVGVEAVVKGFPLFLAQINAMSLAISGTGVASVSAAAGLAVFTVALAAIVAVVAVVVGGIALIVAGFAALSIGSVNVARSVESAFAGVAKTTNGLTDEFGKMNDAGAAVLDQFRLLALEVPLSLEDLLKIGEIAGQLGIAEDALVGFTEVVAALGAATELTVEEAALGLARLASIYGIATGDMIENTERLGSAITFLGNNFATTEPAILNFAKRLAAIAKQFGITQAEVLGFGAAVTAAGVESQLGATAIQNAFIAIGKAVAEGGEELQVFADTAGMTAEEFIKAWEDDAAQAFVAFIEGLGLAADDAFRILDEVGLSSDRTVRALLPLAAAGDLLARAIDGANEAFEENISLQREVTIRYATFDSQLQIFKNTLRDVGLEIGLMLLPALEDLLAIVTPIVEAIGEGLVPAFKSVFDAINDSLLPALLELVDAFGFDVSNADLTKGIANFGETIAGGIEAFAGFVDSVTELVDLYKEGGIISVAEHFGIDKDTAQLFLDVGAAVLIAAGALTILRGAIFLAGATAGIIGTVAVAFGNLGAAISLIAGGGGILATLGALFLGLPVILLGAVALLIGIIVVFGKDALANFLSLSEQLGEIFVKIWEMAVENFNKLKDQVSEIITKLVEIMLEKGNQILLDWFSVTDKLRDKWKTILDDIKLIAETVTQEILGVLIQRWTDMVDSVTTFFAPIVEDLGQVWEDVKTLFTDAWNFMIDNMRTFGANIGKLIGQLIVLWLAQFNAVAPKWIQAGKDIIAGLLAGLKKNAGQILTFITDLALQALDAIKKALGISSKSTVFMNIGRNMMLGLAAGIAQNANLPQIALNSAATRMISAENGIASSGAISNSIDRSFNPTINANYLTPQPTDSIATSLALVAMLEGAG